MVTVDDWMDVTERNGERRRRTRLSLETTVRGRDGHLLVRCVNQDVTVCRDWEGTTCGLLTQRTQGDKECVGQKQGENRKVVKKEINAGIQRE